MIRFLCVISYILPDVKKAISPSVTAAPAGRGRESQIEGRTGRTAYLNRDIERTEQTPSRRKNQVKKVGLNP